MPRESYLSKIREMVDDLGEQYWLPRLIAIKEYIDSKYKRPAHVYSVTKRLIAKTHKLDDPRRTTVNITFRESRQEKIDSDRRAHRALEKRNQSVAYFKPEYVFAVIRESGQEAGEDPIRKFIALQLACGCRQRDIFDESICTFSLCLGLYGFHPNRIVQSGSSKRRGKPFHHIRPLIGMNVRQFLFKLRTFREWLLANYGHLTTEAMTSKLNRELSHKTKELFPVNQERAGTHVNRAIYAAMVRYNARNDMETASAPRAVQEALGHEKMTSSLHYLYVEIDERGFSQKLS